MFPVFKRTVMMPFIKHQRKRKLAKGMRSSGEVLIRMQDYHNLSLDFDKKGRKDLAKEYQAVSSALGWVLGIGDGNS